VLAVGNQWEATLGRTTDRNTVKEADKRTFDSLGLCSGLCNSVLAVVSVSEGVSTMDTASSPELVGYMLAHGVDLGSSANALL
jgi:hypothetical protein